MALLDDLVALFSAHGLSEDDSRRLINGLRFDLDQLAVRDLLGRQLSRTERQQVRTKLLNGEAVEVIAEQLRARTLVSGD